MTRDRYRVSEVMPGFSAMGQHGQIQCPRWCGNLVRYGGTGGTVRLHLGPRRLALVKVGE